MFFCVCSLWRAEQTHNTRKHREPSIESGPSSTVLAHRVSTQGALGPVDTAAGREPPQDFLASYRVVGEVSLQAKPFLICMEDGGLLAHIEGREAIPSTAASALGLCKNLRLWTATAIA